MLLHFFLDTLRQLETKFDSTTLLFAFLHEQPLLPSNKHNPDHQSEHWVNLDKAVSSGCKVEDPYPFQSRQESATQAQQPNGFFDSYFVSYTAAKIAGWGAPAGPYHPGPPHMSHHPVSGMKDGPPGYPPHPQLMDMYSGVSPATAINTMDWKNTSQVGLHHFIWCEVPIQQNELSYCQKSSWETIGKNVVEDEPNCTSNICYDILSKNQEGKDIFIEWYLTYYWFSRYLTFLNNI